MVTEQHHLQKALNTVGYLKTILYVLLTLWLFFQITDRNWRNFKRQIVAYNTIFRYIVKLSVINCSEFRIFNQSG